MFNKYELQWIQKQLELFRETNEAIIEEMTTLPKEFQGCADKDLMQAVNNIEFATNMENKIVSEQYDTNEQEYVSLDPDHQGELLVLCAKVHAQWDRNLSEKIAKYISDMSYGYYLLGNIEGRLKSGKVTMDDMNILEGWEEELNS